MPRSGSNPSNAASESATRSRKRSRFLLAHLRFPQLHDLVGREHVLLLEQLLHGEQSGLVDENRPLVLLHGVDQRPDRLGRALDDLLDRGDALEEVLVEGEILFLFVLFELVILEGREARQHEQFVLTAVAELPFVVVVGAAGLAEHGRFGGT
jgi:hypothetical protein